MVTPLATISMPLVDIPASRKAFRLPIILEGFLFGSRAFGHQRPGNSAAFISV
jgi:hypothetical protein